MSRIYDALEHAQEKTIKIEKGRATLPSVTLPVNVNNGDVNNDPDLEEEMITLYQTISTSLPNIDHPVVLLVGSRSNEGTSTIARQLAKTVSTRMEKEVLLLDLDRSRPDLHVYGKINIAKVKESESEHENLFRVEDTSLHVMPLFLKSMSTPRTLDAVKDDGFWKPLKERFDLIIVDSPPATTFPDGPGIVSYVDGVILVVEAEKTRWQVALNVKEKITKSGGKILGVVFNRQNYYIPDFIYKRL